jgi:hypothetical protein
MTVPLGAQFRVSHSRAHKCACSATLKRPSPIPPLHAPPPALPCPALPAFAAHAVSFFERAGAAHFNSLVVVDADGQLVGHYRKSHIPDGPGCEWGWEGAVGL